MGMLQPLNIFLRQEIDRMQKVISIVRSTLMDLKLAIDGTIIMSENLRDALDNIFDARVPNTWKKVSGGGCLFYCYGIWGRLEAGCNCKGRLVSVSYTHLTLPTNHRV